MLSLRRLERKQKKIFKSISNSDNSLSFLLIWNWNDKYLHTLPWFPQKPYPIPDQRGQSIYPFSDQNGAKTLSNGAAHTYIAYIRVYPPPPGRLLNPFASEPPTSSVPSGSTFLLSKEKRRKRVGEKAEDKSQNCCISFKPKFCFLRVGELRKMIFCILNRSFEVHCL